MFCIAGVSTGTHDASRRTFAAVNITDFSVRKGAGIIAADIGSRVREEDRRMVTLDEKFGLAFQDESLTKATEATMDLVFGFLKVAADSEFRAQSNTSRRGNPEQDVAVNLTCTSSMLESYICKVSRSA